LPSTKLMRLISLQSTSTSEGIRAGIPFRRRKAQFERGLNAGVEILSKELGVLKNLFSNVGVLPDQLHREIAKHLGEGVNGRSLPSNGL